MGFARRNTAPEFRGGPLENPQWFPTYRSGAYYFCNSPGDSAANGAFGNGVLRLGPWVVTEPLTIVRIGTEFTIAGEANSVFRIAVYNDDGSGQPAAEIPILDAGTISTGSGNAGNVATGGTPGSYEITVSQTLQPGLDWAGGAVQGASTTQPTMRVGVQRNFVHPFGYPSIPAAGAIDVGWRNTGSSSGAAPAWVAGTQATTGIIPRIFFKAA